MSKLDYMWAREFIEVTGDPEYLGLRQVDYHPAMLLELAVKQPERWGTATGLDILHSQMVLAEAFGAMGIMNGAETVCVIGVTPSHRAGVFPSDSDYICGQVWMVWCPDPPKHKGGLTKMIFNYGTMRAKALGVKVLRSHVPPIDNKEIVISWLEHMGFNAPVAPGKPWELHLEG